MGQLLHGSATTTEAIRRAIQVSQESLRGLARRYGINQKMVAKWQARGSVTDMPTGPKEPKSTVFLVEDEAIIVAFRRHTLLPLDDLLYALQRSLPQLTRSSLHRCLVRHGMSRLPEPDSASTARKRFKVYPIGYFQVDVEPAVRRTSPRSAPSRGASTCLSPSTEPPSSTSLNSTGRSLAATPPTSSGRSSRPCLIASTPCSRTTARTLPHRATSARRPLGSERPWTRGSAFSPMSSSMPAPRTTSITG